MAFALTGLLMNNPQVHVLWSPISSYLDSLSSQTPPRSIPSLSTTLVKQLQQKLAFLQDMAAFVRPSDLVRTPFESCKVREFDGCLTLVVNAPKEKQKKRRIIKPFTIHPHNSDVEICPLQCFKALKALWEKTQKWQF
ncbi:hypothetical protein INT46_001981 [Mucor plumbeus]|uniref:Uncharacterized protein n=1 Tax=Mucor plumbeus TaxID=97098 RepID=A0A8H7RC62_9FUNG|nr:hypothetical protein INT46_001981 [Mucor plumbeus]